MALLTASGLQKWYGRSHVVKGVSYEVEAGEIVGLLGPNGAGKTTSFRMTIGLIDPDAGSIVFDGKDITKLAMYQRAREGIGYLAQDSSVFKQLSVEDNLMAILETRRLGRRERRKRQDELLEQFGLTHRRKVKANRISGGERRRLEIARSLITEPKMIMLDEPFAGIDPITVQEIKGIISDLARERNLGILLTDHAVWDVLNVTDRNVVIAKGEVIATGSREAIINNESVRRVYIGEGGDGRREMGEGSDGRRDPGHPTPSPPHPAPEPVELVSAHAPAPPPPETRAELPQETNLLVPEVMNVVAVPPPASKGTVTPPSVKVQIDSRFIPVDRHSTDQGGGAR